MGRRKTPEAAAGNSPTGAADPAEPAEAAADATPSPKRPKSARATKVAATKAAKAAAADAAEEAAAATPKRGKKARAAAQPTDEGDEGDEPAAAKPKRATKAKPAAEDGAEPPAKKKRTRKDPWPPGPLYESSMRPERFEGPGHRFLSWNVAGLRGMLKKNANALKELAEAEQLDAICLQETKLQESNIEAVVEAVGLEGWEAVWAVSTDRKGHSGTAILCKEKPLSSRVGIGQEEHDKQGRVVTVELPDLWLLSVYVPNSGNGLVNLDYRIKQWDGALAAYIKGLQATKPVVVAGDLNCCHKEIDIAIPKNNLRHAGFTIEERESFSAGLLGEVGLVDTFRAQHPGVVGYTYYSYRFKARETGKGWRLDYMLVSPQLAERVHDSYILKNIEGSDHVPLGIVIKKQQQ